MHTCTYIPLKYLKFQQWYKVEICGTNDLYETMTRDDLKIKTYLVLKIVFSLLYICFKT